MIQRPEYVRTDIINKLKAAHANLEQMSPEEIREVLAESIEIIRTLRVLIGIKDDLLLEDTPPEGNA